MVYGLSKAVIDDDLFDDSINAIKSPNTGDF